MSIGPVISKWDYRGSVLQGNYSIGRSKDGCGSITSPSIALCLSAKGDLPRDSPPLLRAFAAVVFVSSPLKNNLLKVRNACG
jgi:hypothetical protein